MTYDAACQMYQDGQYDKRFEYLRQTIRNTCMCATSIEKNDIYSFELLPFDKKE